MQQIMKEVEGLERETMVNQYEYSEKANVWQLMKLKVGKGLKISPRVKYVA